MDPHDPITPAPAPTTPAGPPIRRSALFGAVAGMGLLAASLVAVGSVAGAVDPTTPAPTDTTESTAPADGPAAIASLDEAAWADYDACMAEQLGDLWIEPVMVDQLDGFDPANPPEDLPLPAPGDPGDWEADAAAWDAADAACADLLPDEIKAEKAAWDAFDRCLADAGVFDEAGASSTEVTVDSPDGFSIASFGEGDGSVTITRVDGSVTVTTDGDVAVLDEAALDAQWKAFDEAQATCADLLPDDMKGPWFADGFGELDGELPFDLPVPTVPPADGPQG